MFDEFLKFGGIHKSTRIGQGGGKRTKKTDNLDGMSKEDQELQEGDYDVDWVDKLEKGKWEVDFEGIAKSYL